MKPAPAPLRLPWHRRLHVRLSAAVGLPVLALAAAMTLAARGQAERDVLEVTQRLQLGLAATIVAQQPGPLIGADGRPNREALARLAMHTMALNPAVEVYLLDPQGRVLAHALDTTLREGAQVDLRVVRPLAERSIAPPRLPLLGDDPRRPGMRNVVSVEGLSLDDRMTGYLYVVLQGQTQQAVAAAVAASGAWRERAAFVALAVLAAVGLGMLLTTTLTRPLRRLTADVGHMQAVTDPDATASPEPGPPPRDEVDALAQATRAMQRRISEQLERLQDHDRLRRELLSNISHDLHTPLAGARGYVEAVLLGGDRQDASTRAEQLHTAMRHLQRLQRRIADLFRLSKLDAGQLTPRLEVFPIGELLQDVVQGGQLAACERGVTLALAGDGAGGARVRADIELIERVLQNLVDNALRHTPPGGSVSLAAAPEGGERLRVCVVDTGSGIAREHLPHIFERYWRAADLPSAPAENAGTGLGLAIVKRILDLHGSVVRVKSEPAHGTQIEFSLPQAA